MGQVNESHLVFVQDDLVLSVVVRREHARGSWWQSSRVAHGGMLLEHCPVQKSEGDAPVEPLLHPWFKLNKRAMAAVEEMRNVGIEPNIKTYTTLIHGWALASHPEKALACFEEMKQVGLEPDQAVYHCLMTSLLSRAVVAQSYVYSGVLSISKEMLDVGVSVDLGTASHWSKNLRKLERVPAELTRAVEKLFPPSWYSYNKIHEMSYTEYLCYTEDKNDHLEDSDEIQTFGLSA